MKVGLLLLCLYIYLPEVTDSAAVEAPLDIITLDDITPLERKHLDYLEREASRTKRSGGILSAIGQTIKNKLGMIAKSSAAGSASASGHFSKGSSGGGYHEEHHEHAEPHDHHEVPETYDHKSFDFWSLKKSILNTLLQAAKAIKGGILAVKGQLIKGSGYLVSAKGKLISAQGDAITNLGKNIATSAVLSPYPGHGHSSSYSASGPSYESHHNEYGPPSHHEAEFSAPSAPSPEYGTPDHHKPPHNIYLPEKYAEHYQEKHKLPAGAHAGILLLKKLPIEHHEEVQESKIPEFKPLLPHPPKPTFHSLLTTLFASSSSKHKPELHKPPPPEDHKPHELEHHELEHPDHSSFHEPESSHPPPPPPSKIVEHPSSDLGHLDFLQNIKPTSEVLQEPSANLFAHGIGNNQYLPRPTSSNPSFDFPGLENKFNLLYNTNLPINTHELPSIDSFGPYPGPLPTGFAAQHNIAPYPTDLSPNSPNFYNLLGPTNLQNPRSVGSFLPTPLSNPGPQLFQPNNLLPQFPIGLHDNTRHITAKRAPIKQTTGRKIPQNFDVVKSVTYQLGPKGPVKL